MKEYKENSFVKWNLSSNQPNVLGSVSSNLKNWCWYLYDNRDVILCCNFYFGVNTAHRKKNLPLSFINIYLWTPAWRCKTIFYQKSDIFNPFEKKIILINYQNGAELDWELYIYLDFIWIQFRVHPSKVISYFHFNSFNSGCNDLLNNS